MAHAADNQGTVEVAVVGGGPAGLTAAVALALAGVETALIAPPNPGDNRTTALLAGSVNALETLGIWARCRDHARPLAAIRIVDDRGGLLHAPEVLFRAEEIGLPAFGYNIANRDLVPALAKRAGELTNLRWIAASAASLEASDDAVALTLSDATTLRTKLTVGADGRNSLCRDSAGIAVDRWSYPQTAITCNLDHTRSHEDISTEFHTASGPFTLVPLAEKRSSLVWVVRPAEAARLAELDDDAFSLTAERQAHSLLGKMRAHPERAAFPLAGQTARHLARDRVALVGEAAHVMPPIGAQGFNLGLRDAATLAELVADARAQGLDVGSPEVLQQYERRRSMDVRSRAAAVDLLNRSLLTDFLPLQGLRGLGLHLVDRIGPLRRTLMREGVAPRADEPRLMRGEAI